MGRVINEVSHNNQKDFAFHNVSKTSLVLNKIWLFAQNVHCGVCHIVWLSHTNFNINILRGNNMIKYYTKCHPVWHWINKKVPCSYLVNHITHLTSELLALLDVYLQSADRNLFIFSPYVQIFIIDKIN